jgi:hypothetical protein
MKETKNFDKIVKAVYGQKRNRDDRPKEKWFEQLTEEKLYSSKPYVDMKEKKWKD